MHLKIESSWKEQLKEEFDKEYLKVLTETVREKYLSTTVFPPPKQIFNAFTHTPFENVKVIILGQDPYHGPSQAMGLSFSVPDNVKIPPSLRNIYKEITADIGTPPPESGNLERWANQGVLLLNATLTVDAHQAGSHRGLGWEQFTDAVIQKLSDEKEHLVFMLWGRYAKNKGKNIDRTRHCVLEAAHPSPLSAHNGFFGCRHFSQCNQYLTEHGAQPIAW